MMISTVDKGMPLYTLQLGQASYIYNFCLFLIIHFYYYYHIISSGIVIFKNGQSSLVLVIIKKYCRCYAFLWGEKTEELRGRVIKDKKIDVEI